MTVSSRLSTSVPRQPRRRVGATLQLVAAAAVAALPIALLGDYSSTARSWTLTSGRRPASSASGRWISRRAAGEDVATTVEDIGAPMTDAETYGMDVDPISGDLDVSELPSGQGVYAVFDAADKLQYIGLSRQLSKTIAGHGDTLGLQEASSLIATVRCLEMPGQSKEALKETWERWIREHMDGGGEIPAGNLPESAPGSDPRWRSRAGQEKAPLNLSGVRGITNPHEAMAAVERAVKQHPVILFMKGSPAMPQCGFSARTVGILRKIGSTFEAVNILDSEANPGVREAIKEYSKWPTIPQLYINGELIGGADIVAELDASGQLAPQIRAAASGAGPAGSEEKTSASSSADTGAAEPGALELVSDSRRPTASMISKVLNENLQLRAFRIFDDSASHEGDAGALEMGLTSESHFRVEIVAPDFEGMSAVVRQQKVFGLLSDVMPRIHALSLVTKTPTEA